MEEKFENKVAVVTGGGSGIGRAIAEKLAKEGANVIIVGRTEASLKETAEADKKITYVVGDITKDKTIEQIIKTVQDKFGRLDILVNMTIHALPLIRKAKGCILNISSVGATHRAKNLSMYVGAKAAVENFTRVWALELAEDGVRVNAIAPGAIRTNIWNVTDLSP